MVNTKIRLIILFAAKDGKALYSQKKTNKQKKKPRTKLGADYHLDHELLIAKFILKLKKVGKTTRPFRYVLNQIIYDYKVEMRNRFKGLDLIDRVPDELWMEVRTLYRRQELRPSPRKRNTKKQNGCLRRTYKYL